MKQKLLRIQFLYDNVKGGAETIAQHIAQERKKYGQKKARKKFQFSKR